MKRQKLARATQDLWSIHDDLCSVWRELEDEEGIPNRHEMAKQFDEVLEWTEGLICCIEDAERTLKNRRRQIASNRN
jgi:hypothetical protein